MGSSRGSNHFCQPLDSRKPSRIVHGRSSNMTKKKGILVTAVLIVSALVLSGCVRVPAQAVVLSRTVGERLPDLQTSHEAFVSVYFQLARARVEDFLDQRWIPTFLGNFVQHADLMQKLENVQALTPEQNTRLQAKLQDAGIS